MELNNHSNVHTHTHTHTLSQKHTHTHTLTHTHSLSNFKVKTLTVLPYFINLNHDRLPIAFLDKTHQFISQNQHALQHQQYRNMTTHSQHLNENFKQMEILKLKVHGHSCTKTITAMHWETITTLLLRGTHMICVIGKVLRLKGA